MRDKLFAGGFRSDDYHQVSLNTMDKLRGAPVNPKSFAVNARKKHFTNGADCENVVLPRYEETFRVVVADATQIDYRGRQVDNEKFRDIMAVFQQHSNVERIEYIDFSLTELCVSYGGRGQFGEGLHQPEDAHPRRHQNWWVPVEYRESAESDGVEDLGLSSIGQYERSGPVVAT